MSLLPSGSTRCDVQDDIKKLKDNKEQLNDEIGLVENRLSDLKQHLGELKSALSETGWEVKQKNGEISLLKTQLKDVLNTGREAQNQVITRASRSFSIDLSWICQL